MEVLRLPEGAAERDVLAVEEPLEIRINGASRRRDDADARERRGARARLLPFRGAAARSGAAARRPRGERRRGGRPGFDPGRLQRSFYTSSSCGVCGKGALEAVAVEAPRVESRLTVSATLVSSLPDRSREAQPAFAATGGLHATGLFSTDGELLCLREDVGRHNALDKVVGWAFGEGRLPLAQAILCVSGRLSFELVQKAAVAGCPVMVAVGAPSSLAVQLRGRPWDHALRLRPRRADERLHGAVADQGLTGVLLVGGASERFGTPKALARIDGWTLAEIAWEKLAFCDERIAVGKREDGLELPFPVLDDGTETRAPVAGVVAGLRAAANDLCLVLPVDVPRISQEALEALVAAGGDAAVPQTGPLPGAYRRSALPVLERRLADGELALRGALDELDTRLVMIDPALLANVNTPDDLASL